MHLNCAAVGALGAWGIAGATLGLQGPRGADRHLRGSSNKSVVSSGEPQVSGFRLIFSIRISQEEEWLSLGYVARGEEGFRACT